MGHSLGLQLFTEVSAMDLTAWKQARRGRGRGGGSVKEPEKEWGKAREEPGAGLPGAEGARRPCRGQRLLGQAPPSEPSGSCVSWSG